MMNTEINFIITPNDFGQGVSGVTVSVAKGSLFQFHKILCEDSEVQNTMKELIEWAMQLVNNVVMYDKEMFWSYE
jgi:hypothetical protein